MHVSAVVCACERVHGQVNRECCSPYYGVLVKIDKEEQKASFQALLNGLKAFSKELEKTPGPTFVAGAQLSAADISILPWAFRCTCRVPLPKSLQGREKPVTKPPAKPACESLGRGARTRNLDSSRQVLSSESPTRPGTTSLSTIGARSS